VHGVLYPRIFDGSQGYTDWFTRYVLINSDIIFNCQAHALSKARNNDTYGYLFDVAPALHGQDIDYTFFVDDSLAEVVSMDTAHTLQDWIVTFMMSGALSTAVPGVPEFPFYGGDGQIMVLGANSTVVAKDPAANSRCDWWNKALHI